MEKVDVFQIRKYKRRRVSHEKKNCECDGCLREMIGLPPAPTKEEQIASWKIEEKAAAGAKKKAKKEIKLGKQKTVSSFFGKPK
jgi:hypothetical protein